MSEDRYKWSLASRGRYSEDIKDCEREAAVLQLTRVRAETGRRQSPQGDDASSLVRNGLWAPASAQAGLKEAPS